MNSQIQAYGYNLTIETKDPLMFVKIILEHPKYGNITCSDFQTAESRAREMWFSGFIILNGKKHPYKRATNMDNYYTFYIEN